MQETRLRPRAFWGLYRTSFAAFLRSSATCLSPVRHMTGAQVAARRCVAHHVQTVWVLMPVVPLQVLQAYETQGFDMLLKAFNEQGYLETLTGLDKLYDETQAALESGWDEEGGGDDDF